MWRIAVGTMLVARVKNTSCCKEVVRVVCYICKIMSTGTQMFMECEDVGNQSVPSSNGIADCVYGKIEIGTKTIPAEEFNVGNALVEKLRINGMRLEWTLHETVNIFRDPFRAFGASSKFVWVFAFIGRVT